MCFENIPCKALHSGKKGFGMAHRRCEIITAIITENLPFLCL